MLVPHERELVARYRGRPFALAGVNGDDDRAKAKDVTVKEHMTWRSFWGGPKGPRGPIPFAWNVTEWPSTYVLDANGVIRFKSLPAKELDEALERLVREAESREPGKGGLNQ